MSDDGYVLDIKASARKHSAGAGEWVNLEGSTRRFDSKALAREWARSCSSPTATVWVQDAVPWDGSGVDGYLVARSTPAGPASAGEAGEQATIEDGAGEEST